MKNAYILRRAAAVIAALGLAVAGAAQAGGDDSPPAVGVISPSSAQINVATNFSVDYLDNVGVTGCDLWVNGVNQGAMSLSGSTSGIATRSHTLTTAGSFEFRALCRDAANNFGAGTLVTVTTPPPPNPDVTAPSAPTGVHLAGSFGDGRVSLQWNASTDDNRVAGYQVRVDGGSYIDLGNYLNTTVGPLANGTHTFGVRAYDPSGNLSGTTTISFAINPPPPPPSFSLEQMDQDAGIVLTLSRQDHIDQIGKPCELADADASARVTGLFGSAMDANVRQMLVNFTACGTTTSLRLGAGERMGVVNSYKAAFGRLPSSRSHWFDVMKIANGRFPGEISTGA